MRANLKASHIEPRCQHAKPSGLRALPRAVPSNAAAGTAEIELEERVVAAVEREVGIESSGQMPEDHTCTSTSQASPDPLMCR